MTTWENFMVSEQWQYTSCNSLVYVFIIQVQQKTKLGLYESKK